MVVNQVFTEPVPDARVIGPATLLQTLQAGIEGRMALLEDATLTGIGESCSGPAAGPGRPCLGKNWLVTLSGKSPSAGPVGDHWNHSLPN